MHADSHHLACAGKNGDGHKAGLKDIKTCLPRHNRVGDAHRDKSEKDGIPARAPARYSSLLLIRFSG